MPWIKKETCTGCGICIDECPVNAIALDGNDVAEIADNQCIRCGRCHDVCPREAVQHDSERIPQEIADNLQHVRQLLDHFDGSQEKADFLQRMMRFYNKEKKVCEQTLSVLGNIDGAPAQSLEAAINDYSSKMKS